MAIPHIDAIHVKIENRPRMKSYEDFIRGLFFVVGNEWRLFSTDAYLGCSHSHNLRVMTIVGIVQTCD